MPDLDLVFIGNGEAIIDEPASQPAAEETIPIAETEAEPCAA